MANVRSSLYVDGGPAVNYCVLNVNYYQFCISTFNRASVCCFCVHEWDRETINISSLGTACTVHVNSLNGQLMFYSCSITV